MSAITVQPGKHMLALSSSQFDPNRKSANRKDISLDRPQVFQRSRSDSYTAAF